MAIRKLLALIALLCWAIAPANATSSPYLALANAAALWLESQQNNDGSWGAITDIRLLSKVTSEFGVTSSVNRVLAALGIH